MLEVKPRFFWAAEVDDNNKPVLLKTFSCIVDLVDWIKLSPKNRNVLKSDSPYVKKARKQYIIEAPGDITEL